jgi:hypothetical protein
MGAKTWMLAYADVNAREALKAHGALNREATWKLATDLFPGEKLDALGDATLSNACPPDKELCIGSFPGVSIVAAREFGIDYPSRLPDRFVAAGGRGTTILHAMHSVVDWFAYAQWSDGKLIRSLSLSPDSGILEDIGPRMRFEEPFWAGNHPVNADGDDAYPFPFHPLELGEVALAELLGYQLEGTLDPALLLDPETIPLLRYRRSRSRWKFWQ